VSVPVTNSNLFQLVMYCIQGGPADRAGIHEGDELVEIDGIYFFALFIFLVITQGIPHHWV